MRAFVSVALAPETWKTMNETAGLPSIVPWKLYDCEPSSTRATSFRRSTLPSPSARTTMLPNSSTLTRRPRYFMVYWKVLSEFSPSEPVGDSMFCSPSTAVMSDGTSPYCAITSGLSQIRMLYVSPISITSPTPSMRLICGMMLMSR